MLLLRSTAVVVRRVMCLCVADDQLLLVFVVCVLSLCVACLRLVVRCVLLVSGCSLLVVCCLLVAVCGSLAVAGCSSLRNVVVAVCTCALLLWW